MLFSALIGIVGIGLEISQAMSLSLKKSKRAKRKDNGTKVQPGTCNIRLHVATVSSAFRRTKRCKYSDALRVLLYTINSTVLLPSQASTLLRLVCRRVASRYPAPGFGSAIQSPCAPYRLRHGILAISGSGSITRCYDTRTYNVDTREQQEKRSGQCRGNSSRFFRRSRCKFNGRQVGATATSYLDI